MKLFDVAWKDMRQSFRSLTGIMFMFVVPILVTALFWFLFGGGGAENSFSLPKTSVVVVNLDQGSLPTGQFSNAVISTGQPIDLSQIRSMGDLLQQILQGEAFTDLLTVTTTDDPAVARSTVDDQEANAALIIPADFTDALMLPDETADIDLYHDPTLTIGPAILESIIQQFADNFSFTKIGTEVALTQLAENGYVINETVIQQVVDDMTTAAFSQAQTGESMVVVQASEETAETNPVTEIVGQIMGGMMVFFAFFTGAGTLQTILFEEETGTLSRLFTTPTPTIVILGGKMLGTFITLLVQVTILLSFGWLVFGIQWGDLLTVILAAAGIIFLSAATGLFLASMVTSTRQSGAIYGGVLTLTGMIGMLSIFTGGQVSPTLEAITLVVPQGWAVRGLQTAMQGGLVVDILPTLAGLLVWIALFVGIGQYRLNRRFA